MYEDRLGTDWEELSDDEAIGRAYALGVAASFGYENREEFDRLAAAVDTSYDRSIVDLAYREGRREAEVVREDGDVAADDAVWDRLVDGTAPDARETGAAADAGSAAPTGRPFTATDLPAALRRAGLLGGGGGHGALDRPGLLGGDDGREADSEAED